jgi:hypothetical protein
MTKRKPYVVHRQFNEEAKAVIGTETIQWQTAAVSSTEKILLYYLRLRFGHCFVSVLLTALVCSLYCLYSTYGFRLVIALFVYYLRLSFGHYFVPALLTAFTWSLYCLCSTYGFHLVIVLSLYYLRLFVWSLHCLCNTHGFRLVIVFSLYYLRLLFVIDLSLCQLRL